MRRAASLLRIASLIAGLLGALTAYLPSLDRPDARLLGLTLNAPAGLRRGPNGAPQPIAAKNARLTSELLRELRGAGVRRVRVKEFALARWDGAWWLAAGCAGLALAAALGRTRRRPAAADSPSAGAADPAAALATVVRAVDDLRAGWPGLADGPARCQRALAVLGTVQENLIPEFIARRPLLTERLGLAGDARLMDRFAAGERQLNRAWSAAADRYDDEVIVCLDRASRLLGEAARELRSAGPGGSGR